MTSAPHLERLRLVMCTRIVQALNAVLIETGRDGVAAVNDAAKRRRRVRKVVGDVAGNVEVAEPEVVEVNT